MQTDSAIQSAEKQRISLDSLPNELLNSIPIDLDDTEGGYQMILALMLTCKRFLPVFQEKLNKHIKVDWLVSKRYNLPEYTPHETTRLDGFLSALVCRPELINTVKSLTLKHVPLRDVVNCLLLSRACRELHLKNIVIWSHPEEQLNHRARDHLRDVLRFAKCETMELVIYDIILNPHGYFSDLWNRNPRNENMKELTLWRGTAGDGTIEWILRTMPNLKKLNFVHALGCKNKKSIWKWPGQILQAEQMGQYIDNLQRSYRNLEELEILTRTIPDCLSTTRTCLMRDAIGLSPNLKRLTIFPQAYLDDKWC